MHLEHPQTTQKSQEQSCVQTYAYTHIRTDTQWIIEADFGSNVCQTNISISNKQAPELAICHGEYTEPNKTNISAMHLNWICLHGRVELVGAW